MRKLFLLIVLAAVAGGLYAFWPGDGGESAGVLRTIAVEKGTITRHAVAVGRVEAKREIAVKSLTGGILTRLFVKLGQQVKKGEPLAEVRPVIAEIDHIRAERALEAAQQGEDNANEFAGGEHLAGVLMRMFQGGKNMTRMQENARRSRAQAEEQIKLLQQGRVKIAGREVDYVVRAPADGHVVDVRSLEGTPVVASSSYGSGTVLMTLADLDRPVFRGTVDEIDVGRLKDGMRASVKLGALPGLKMEGQVVEIGLRASRRNNAVVFDVRLDLDPIEDDSVVLRSGYSAVARIRIAERADVLVLPERVVTFEADGAYVLVEDGSKDGRRQRVETGLSDGLQVEIVSGLGAGAEVLESTGGAR